MGVLTIAQKDGPRVVHAVEHAEQATTTTGHGLQPGDRQPFLFRRFELTSALSKNGTASAILVFYDVDSYKTNTNATFDVADADGTYSGNIGARGLCVKMKDRIEWEVRDITCAS